MRRLVDVSLREDLERLVAARPDGSLVETDRRIRKKAHAALCQEDATTA